MNAVLRVAIEHFPLLVSVTLIALLWVNFDSIGTYDKWFATVAIIWGLYLEAEVLTT